MTLIEWLGYRTKLVLLGLFGPPRLDDDSDPIVQLKREHGQPTDGKGTPEGG